MNAITEASPFRLPSPTLSGSSTTTNKGTWGPAYEVPSAGNDYYSPNTYSTGSSGIDYSNPFGSDLVDSSIDFDIGEEA